MAISNPKVKRYNRDEILKLIRYHAAYSENFVASVLKEVGADQDHTILLDQFIGSGTTALTALRSNRIKKGYGFDLNPVAILLSRLVVNHERPSKDHLNIFSKILTEHNKTVIETKRRHYLTDIDEILAALIKKIDGSSYNLLDNDIAKLSIGMTIRELELFSRSSNPSWIKKNGTPQGEYIEWRKFKNKTLKNSKYIIDLLEQEHILRHEYKFSKPKFEVQIADARNLPLNDNSVNLVITSPPYLSRVDYVKQVLGEIYVIGRQQSEWRASLRGQMMGTVKMRSEKEIPKFGDYVTSILEKIRNHNSKSSENYYYPFHQQYFSDLKKVLSENFRVLQPAGESYWVVQNSFYKEIEIDFYEIISEMLCEIGYRSHEVVHYNHTKNFIGKSNPNQRKWNADRKLTEYVIKFIK